MATRLAHPKILRLNWGAGASDATKTSLDTPAATGGGCVDRADGGLSGDQAADHGRQLRLRRYRQRPARPDGRRFAIANFDDNQHARNENLRLGNLWDGIEVYAGLLADLDW